MSLLWNRAGMITSKGYGGPAPVDDSDDESINRHDIALEDLTDTELELETVKKVGFDTAVSPLSKNRGHISPWADDDTRRQGIERTESKKRLQKSRTFTKFLDNVEERLTRAGAILEAMNKVEEEEEPPPPLLWDDGINCTNSNSKKIVTIVRVAAGGSGRQTPDLMKIKRTVEVEPDYDALHHDREWKIAMEKLLDGKQSTFVVREKEFKECEGDIELIKKQRLMRQRRNSSSSLLSARRQSNSNGTLPLKDPIPRRLSSINQENIIPRRHSIIDQENIPISRKTSILPINDYDQENIPISRKTSILPINDYDDVPGTTRSRLILHKGKGEEYDRPHTAIGSYTHKGKKDDTDRPHTSIGFIRSLSKVPASGQSTRSGTATTTTSRNTSRPTSASQTNSVRPRSAVQASTFVNEHPLQSRPKSALTPSRGRTKSFDTEAEDTVFDAATLHHLGTLSQVIAKNHSEIEIVSARPTRRESEECTPICEDKSWVEKPSIASTTTGGGDSGGVSLESSQNHEHTPLENQKLNVVHESPHMKNWKKKDKEVLGHLHMNRNKRKPPIPRRKQNIPKNFDSQKWVDKMKTNAWNEIDPPDPLQPKMVPSDSMQTLNEIKRKRSIVSDPTTGLIRIESEKILEEGVTSPTKRSTGNHKKLFQKLNDPKRPCKKGTVNESRRQSLGKSTSLSTIKSYPTGQESTKTIEPIERKLSTVSHKTEEDNIILEPIHRGSLHTLQHLEEEKKKKLDDTDSEWGMTLGKRKKSLVMPIIPERDSGPKNKEANWLQKRSEFGGTDRSKLTTQTTVSFGTGLSSWRVATLEETKQKEINSKIQNQSSKNSEVQELMEKAKDRANAILKEQGFSPIPSAPNSPQKPKKSNLRMSRLRAHARSRPSSVNSLHRTL